MKVVFIEVSTGHHREIVEALAREIWTEHYIAIIGKEQVDYMLGRFQSRQAIGDQIKSGVLYFLIRENDTYIGYLAVQPKGRDLFLSKIYVKAVRRGEGYGRQAVQFAEKIAKDKNLEKIILTVNKHNEKSIRAYEKLGFHNVGSLVQDIGDGFVMDDFQMEKIL